MGNKAKNSGNGHKQDQRFRFRDLLIILLCLSGAAYFVYLFRLDLFNTLDSKNEKPVGTIIIKNNVVQRRMAKRVLWDRLVVDSPAYMGDTVRTADISSATLHIEDNSLDLSEKTLIRIQRSRDGDGLIQIDLEEGNMSLSAGTGNLTLNLMGRRVKAGPETTLNAAAGKDGIVVKVGEGDAVFTDGERRREIAAGGMVSLDANGVERMEKSAVAIRPLPNARYLKDKPEPLHVNFVWNRVNLDPGDTLRLEIAGDRNFNNITRVIENISDAAEAALGAGPWYWRLSSTEPDASRRILLTERFTVTESAGPALLSPVTDSLYRYRYELPQLRFQWSEVGGASSYILEASATPDFINPYLRMETASVFSLNPGLGQGTWYWRVLPVFPSVYEGAAAFSPAAFFRIEQNTLLEAALILPETVRPPEPVPLNVTLLSPAQGSSLPGLTALRRQTVFRWDSGGEITRSRFILSRNRNPLTGRPVAEIINPDRTVRLNRLEPGDYYWTVEVRGPDGIISAATPRQLQITAIPLLPAPGNLRPAGGSRIGIEQLKQSNRIVFSWSAVQGANAYIFTLYEQTGTGRRQIIRRPPQTRTSWTLDNLAPLGRGAFVWQVEAVNRNSASVIEQRGRIGEGTFTLDVPAPGTVHFEDPGTLYGY